MRYVMLINGIEDEWEAVTGAERDAAMTEIYAWFERWSAAGKLAGGSEELDSVRRAKTVRRGPDGRPVVTDGPYLELKEVIGGIVMIDADSPDEAVELASTWPGLQGNNSVEVRPVIAH